MIPAFAEGRGIIETKCFLTVHTYPHLLVEVDGSVVPAEAGLSARAEVAADGHQDLGGVLVMADVRTRVVLVTSNPAHSV